MSRISDTERMGWQAPAGQDLAEVEHLRAELDAALAKLERVARVLRQVPRYADPQLEAAADAVVEDVRAAMADDHG